MGSMGDATAGDSVKGHTRNKSGIQTWGHSPDKSEREHQVLHCGESPPCCCATRAAKSWQTAPCNQQGLPILH